MSRPVLLTVSGTIPADLATDIAEGRRPRADYLEMAAATNADLADQSDAIAGAGRLGRVLHRVGGPDAVLALHCFRRRRQHRVIVTDGEGVGLLYAAMSGFARRRGRHVMIGHRLTAKKKLLMHRFLGLRRRIDHIVVYSSVQRHAALSRLGYHPRQVTLMPFMVDTEFWDPDRITATERTRPMICAAGRELRDYATMIEAVRGLDVDVVLAAASPWSRRADRVTGLDIPTNVTVTSLGHYDLRQLYGDAAFVVVPLEETDFQAGITTILEAMAMARAVVCTRTTGQTDTIQDGTTGLYAAPGDVAAMRSAIERLLADPDEAARLGAAGRRWAREHADIEVYATRFAALVEQG